MTGLDMIVFVIFVGLLVFLGACAFAYIIAGANEEPY